MILAAEFPAIPSSAVKIASERRCAILVHSGPNLGRDSQQLTCGVVSEGVFAESVRKFCGKFPETTFYCVRKGCGNSAESLRKFAEICGKFSAMTPFPNDPISELSR